MTFMPRLALFRRLFRPITAMRGRPTHAVRIAAPDAKSARRTALRPTPTELRGLLRDVTLAGLIQPIARYQPMPVLPP